MRHAIFALIGLLIFSCGQKNQLSEKTTVRSGSIHLDRAIEAHGGDRYQEVNLAFDFRERSFTVFHQDAAFRYTSQFVKDDHSYYDVLSNDGFTRQMDGKFMELADSNVIKYSSSLNSVIYFALLPHKLLDPAAQVRDIGQTLIKDQNYHVVEVTFRKEGGGKDYDDNFHYWINASNHYVDYLAYDYQVDGGGVRFREAYNPREVAGIRFQDYVNYKAPVGTKLADLPHMLEAGQLEELSRIELKNIETTDL